MFAMIRFSLKVYQGLLLSDFLIITLFYLYICFMLQFLTFVQMILYYFYCMLHFALFECDEGR